MSKHPARTPVVAPVYDPNNERYWDPKDLEQELLRTFQVCHECRMCVTYCGSFPILFDAIDREIDGGRAEGSENVDAKTIHAVTDHCWQCKLCYIKCPYTPDEGAHELLDFPRLMAREKAQRSRRDGVPLVDQVLGEPQRIGALSAGPQAKIANFVNSTRLLRKVAEKVIGISAEFPLPPIATRAFTSWHRSHSRGSGAGENGQVVLFPTCYGEYNFPEVPRAAVQVLERNGFEVLVPEALTCCGMPNLDGGDIDAARRKMQANVEALAPYVKRGLPIVVPGPTCGYTMKKEWPVYLATQDAKDVAGRTFDLMEYLDGLRRQKKLVKSFVSGLGKVAYHASCHLRAQKIAIPGARVLSLLPDTDVRIIERCSAVDGTWGMKAKYYAEGVRYAARLSRAIEDEQPAEGELSVVTDCSLAALRVLKENGRVARHPIVALAEAYGFSAESRTE
ncbi:MAG: heterodisulfide reductase-related iron-sulfur binding cluster [Pseudomonadota bacterium]